MKILELFKPKTKVQLDDAWKIFFKDINLDWYNIDPNKSIFEQEFRIKQTVKIGKNTANYYIHVNFDSLFEIFWKSRRVSAYRTWHGHYLNNFGSFLLNLTNKYPSTKNAII